MPRNRKDLLAGAAAGLDEDEFPEDIEDSDRYLTVPHRSHLDLGRRLALAFAAAALPQDYDTVAEFFRQRGAYGRFKNLLQARGVLTQWYEFENRATDEALLEWCAERGIHPVASGP